MVYFKGSNKKKSYFEGWYFKHTNKNNSIALIPGISIDEKGRKAAFIQVITNGISYYFPFDYSLFYASEKELLIKIGDNEFSKKGIKINIENDGAKISGELFYEEFTPVKYSIMGPFSLIPFMECNHEIISLFHYVNGNIMIDDNLYEFNKGISYIEKDYGTSFPKKYIWTQCNDFSDEKMCIAVSIADIPFMGTTFSGCICSIYYQNKEYRMATYKGVKILRFTDKTIKLRQGKYELLIIFDKDEGQALFAPKKGDMSKKIKENIACKGRFKFYRDNKLVFDKASENVSLEYEI